MRRMDRWRWLGAWLTAAGLLAGCSQHHFMTEADYKLYHRQALCGDTGTDCTSPYDVPRSPIDGQVRTILSPEARPREITLAECLALAMENGRTSDQINGTFRVTNRNLASAIPDNPEQGTDSIRVFAYTPAIRAIDIEQALAKFDPFYRGTLTHSKVDRPVGTAMDTFQGAFSQINAIAQDTATFQNSINKPLATGGLAGISFNTDYEFSNLNARVNPSYRPVLGFNVEQPLVRGFGVGMNELLDSHPGGLRAQVPTGGRVPGILLSRINSDVSHIEFERRVSNLCMHVEEAYWNLYAAYWLKYARETALRQVLESWNIANAKFKAGSATLLELKRTELQYQNARIQLLQALGGTPGGGGVLEAERQLRYVLGLPLEDGTRLIPLDKPTDAPFRPDWGAAVNEALSLRPDLRQIRLVIQRGQLEVLRANNLALPDVRAFADYSLVGLGNQLDGDTPRNAFYPLLRNQFQNWTIGMNATFTFGGRSENSEIHRAKLQLAQRVMYLQKQEELITYHMGAVIRELAEVHRNIEIGRQLREAAAETVRLRYQAYRAGKETIDFLLQAQQDYADALRGEHRAIADYNIALANFELQKGTLLGYDNVKVMEGPLPDCVAARASEHLRQRAGALVIRESGTSPIFEQTGGLVPPELPKTGALSEKDLHEAARALPPVPEELKPRDEPFRKPEELKQPPEAAPIPPRSILRDSGVPEKPPERR